MRDDLKYVFRGGYIEDPAGDRWWSADLLKRVETERDELRVRLANAELAGARKALDAVVKMLESYGDYGAADDVRAMRPEDIVK